MLDPRFRAALNMDGVMFGRAERDGVEPPVMFMLDARPRPNATDGADELVVRGYASLDATLARHGGYFVRVAGARHDSFADPARWRWMVRREKVAPTIAGIRRYAVAFFDEALKGKRSEWLQEAFVNAPMNGSPQGRRER